MQGVERNGIIFTNSNCTINGRVKIKLGYVMKNIIEVFVCFAMFCLCLSGAAYAECCSKPRKGPPGPPGPTGPAGSADCTTAPSTIGIADIDVSSDDNLYYDVSQFFSIGTGNLLRYEITNITPSSGSDPDPSTIIYINPASGVIINLIPLSSIESSENLEVTVTATNTCGTASSTFTITDVGGSPP